MIKDSCLFCDVQTDGEEIALETKYFYLRFDRFPMIPGHAELIPKRHAVSLLDLEPKEQGDFWIALKKSKTFIEVVNKSLLYEKMLLNPVDEYSKKLIEDALEHIGINRIPDGYNWGVNDGEAAGRTIHHLHVHIIPRYYGDVEDPRGGLRHIIPGMGSY
ncbi:MAG: HIT family protein [Candidatus Spechtbacterales bacterium]|nr:HIT family protein [Candidatus Spechtbacterales bacterium]